MTETPSDCVHCEQLVVAIDDAYERARADFCAPDSSSLAGVVWLAAHLAAIDYAIHPALRRAVPTARGDLRMQRKLAHELQLLLRDVERRRAGDALAAHSPWLTLRDRILASLGDHAAAERDLIRALASEIGPDNTEALLTRYGDAMRHGPTRPHPHMANRGLLGRAAYRIDAVRDRFMDSLDGRTIPLPRVVRDRPKQGRWANYALGSADFTKPDE
jgi:hypothetical protein